MEVLTVLEYGICAMSIIGIGYLTYQLNIHTKREIIAEENREALNKINNKLENMSDCIEYTNNNIELINKMGTETDKAIKDLILTHDNIPGRAQKNLNEIANLTKKTIDTLTTTIKTNMSELQQDITTTKKILKEVVINIQK